MPLLNGLLIFCFILSFMADLNLTTILFVLAEFSTSVFFIDEIRMCLD